MKFLKEFPDAVFLGVDVELLFGEARACRARLEYWFKKAITFDPTVGTATNIYTSFWTIFSLE